MTQYKQQAQWYGLLMWFKCWLACSARGGLNPESYLKLVAEKGDAVVYISVPK